jgi:hypothetical protein
LGAPAIRSDEVARIAELRIACAGSLVGARFGVPGLATSDVLLRVALLDGRVIHRVLRPGKETFVVPARSRPIQVVGSHLGLGAEHVAGGADHLLFLLGLVALAPGWRRLATMVTTFTAGQPSRSASPPWGARPSRAVRSRC